MIVVMSISASEEELQQVVRSIEARGMRALQMPGGERVAIGIPSAIPPDLREPLYQALTVLRARLEIITSNGGPMVPAMSL